MMEEKRIIAVVGNYRHSQAEPTDCLGCKEAMWGTVLIDGYCVDCLFKYTAIAEAMFGYSLEKLSDEELQIVLNAKQSTSSPEA